MTMTTHNNDIYYNAALAGIFAGCTYSADYTPLTAASIATTGGAAFQAACVAAATEIDSLIAKDPDVTVGGGATLLVTPAFRAASTDSAVAPYFSKPMLLETLCEAAFAGKTMLSAVANDYAVLAAGIVAQFNVSKLELAAL